MSRNVIAVPFIPAKRIVHCGHPAKRSFKSK
jgi:hypothetical protein